jgi:hypothetical protein
MLSPSAQLITGCVAAAHKKSRTDDLAALAPLAEVAVTFPPRWSHSRARPAHKRLKSFRLAHMDRMQQATVIAPYEVLYEVRDVSRISTWWRPMMRSSPRSSGVRIEGDTVLRGDARPPARVRDVGGVAKPKTTKAILRSRASETTASSGRTALRIFHLERNLRRFGGVMRLRAAGGARLVSRAWRSGRHRGKSFMQRGSAGGRWGTVLSYPALRPRMIEDVERMSELQTP